MVSSRFKRSHTDKRWRQTYTLLHPLRPSSIINNNIILSIIIILTISTSAPPGLFRLQPQTKNSNQIFCDATSIKWIPGDNDASTAPAASTAPRSQRYWDENNIERPDYAKTDREIQQEERERRKANNGEDATSFWRSLAFWGVVMGAAILFVNFLHTKGMITWKLPSLELWKNSGNRLGNVANPPSKSTSLEEQARMARLAKFSVVQEAEDTGKKDN